MAVTILKSIQTFTFPFKIDCHWQWLLANHMCPFMSYFALVKVEILDGLTPYPKLDFRLHPKIVWYFIP